MLRPAAAPKAEMQKDTKAMPHTRDKTNLASTPGRGDCRPRQGRAKGKTARGLRLFKV